jgi:hypothetical protein
MDAASQLIDSYLNTRFEIDGKFTLRPRIRSVEIERLFSDKNHQSASCITAFNPASKVCSDEENFSFHEKLIWEVESMCIQFSPMLGRCPHGNWKSENGLLLLGISLTQAKQLGRKFNQNAIVFIGKDCIPEIYVIDRSLGFVNTLRPSPV